ncbi:hypothetical protein [Massilia scottii]|uniref:hypothetical protein n=1 Tax=Massilia scottii TaxID=3057166 RepID=UPI00279695C5|nr:hypothetical protein [Massilia sp. CCM 9029]MDQ1835502.1 hypothetical protein [Massilia sp. CCM 9029]
MHLLSAIIAVLLAGISPAGAGPLAPSQDLLTGTWECGPTFMKGPQLVMTVVTVTKRAADRTFVSTSTSVITPRGKPAITLIDSARGTWRLEGRILISAFQESKFISASDPTISAELGQKLQDDQLRNKSIYKAEILQINRKSMRFIPVGSDYSEAVVESNCRKI